MISRSVIRVALVGIDGSGKSTLFDGISRRQIPSVATLSCPDFFRSIDLRSSEALVRDSKNLAELSSCADIVGQSELKYGALFYRMCLSGEAERAVLSNFPNTKLIFQERHPLLDALAYTPLYLSLKSTQTARAERDTLYALFEEKCPRARDAIESRDWIAIDQVAARCRDWISAGREVFVKNLEKHFQVGFPDHVIFLDVSASEATRRLVARSGKLEMHEKSSFLEKLSTHYQQVVGALPAEVKVTHVPVEGRCREELLNQVLSIVGGYL